MGSFIENKSLLSMHLKDAVEKNSFGEFVKNARPITNGINPTDLKNLMELTMREVLISLIERKTDITLLERIFQFSFDAALLDIASGNLPVLVIGDLFEASTIVDCEKTFSFMENRVDTFKKEIFFKACKNHLLRSCNDLLKRLSRSQNTVFCGRILMFLAHIFPLSERSGLNVISEFNLENTTSYATSDDAFSDLNSEKGDNNEEGEISSQSPIVADRNLYKKFWSLQDFFRNPNSCYNKMQWRHFASCTSEVLTVFGSFKSDDANSSKWKQAKLPSPSGASVYFAKYLTSPKLLELELSDSHFRRYVLVQFLILFQYLTSPVRFKLDSFVLTEDQQNWIKEVTKRIYKLLEETPPNGERFAQDTERILQREEYWNAWKNEGCPDFKHVTEKTQLDNRFSKRLAEDLQSYPIKKANSDLPKLWCNNTNNWDACKSAKRNFVPSLESFFHLSSGKADTSSFKKDIHDSRYTWKALRLLCMKSPHIFTANLQQTKGASDYLESVIQKVIKEKPQSQQDVMTVDTAVAEDSIEDGNEEFFQTDEEPKEEEKPKKEKVLTKALIEAISGKLQDVWQILAIHLGFKEDEIEYFASEKPTNKAQTENMLTIWMEQYGSLFAFVKALKGAGCLNTVQHLLPSLD
ncbi:THO complex subunit 1 isoform X4 [Parasteatoda tepidariorum]|uniref:THO complex subunit 1 isoform X3 n=1 Tax=Parasteatoda tepidariorum TaxID=114398 RepID=UPI001C722169|nr:THO complex subunit 1 isoform X3 [Parasteatoda tepidariorum]